MHYMHTNLEVLKKKKQESICLVLSRIRILGGFLQDEDATNNICPGDKMKQKLFYYLNIYMHLVRLLFIETENYIKL